VLYTPIDANKTGPCAKRACACLPNIDLNLEAYRITWRRLGSECHRLRTTKLKR
jgi:hypothetical protein